MTVTTPQQHASRRVTGALAQHAADATAKADWRDPRYQAFALLRLAFTVAPIAFGVDKFFNAMVHWPNYLAPWINKIMPGTGQQFMYFVGVTEIVAGVIVALKPRYGAMSSRAGSPASSSTFSATPASTTSRCGTSG